MIACHAKDSPEPVLGTSGNQTVLNALESIHNFLAQVGWVLHIRIVASLTGCDDSSSAGGNDDGAGNMQEVTKLFAEARGVDDLQAIGVQRRLVFRHD